MWWAPGPNFGYKIKAIDDHPWDTLITMKEILKLQPGSIQFIGEDAARHTRFWSQELPHLFNDPPQSPVFVLDTQLIHPHKVESEPRKPFKPFNDLDHQSLKNE